MNIQVHTWIYGTLEGWSKKTDLCMKAIGIMIKHTVKAFILTWTELSIKESGRKINNTGTINVQTNIHFHYSIIKLISIFLNRTDISCRNKKIKSQVSPRLCPCFALKRTYWLRMSWEAGDHQMQGRILFFV